MRQASQDYVFSWPWFLGGILVLTVLCASTYGLRTVNRENMASQILETSEKLEEDGDYESAIKILTSFLDVNRKSPEAWSKMCALLNKMYQDKKITSPAMLKKSIERQKAALAFIPTESSLEVRERIMEMEYDLAKADRTSKSMSDAIFSADEILKTWKDHAVAKRILALGIYSNYVDYGNIPAPAYLPLDDLLYSALQLNPNDIPLAVSYAQLLRSVKQDQIRLISEKTLAQSPEKRIQDADDTINLMVTRNASDSDAYLERYIYRAANRMVDFQQEELDEDLMNALKFAPQSYRGLRLAGQLVNFQSQMAKGQDKPELAARKRDEAFHFFSLLIKNYPGDAEGYLQTGKWYLAENQTDKALEIWDQGRRNSQNVVPELYAQNAYVLIEQKKYEEAESLIRQLEQLWINHHSNFRPLDASNLSRLYTLLDAKKEYAQRTDIRAQREEYLEKVNEAKLKNLDVDPSLYLAIQDCTNDINKKRISASQLIRKVIDGLPEMEYDLSPSALSRLEGEGFLIYARMQADIGEWEKAAENYSKARAFPTLSAQATLLAADAYQRCNQSEKALALLHSAADRYSSNPQVRLTYLQQLLNREMTKPDPLTRNYEAIETELKKVMEVQSTFTNPWEVDLLRIRFHYLRDGGTLQAQQKMVTELLALEKNPEYEKNIKFLAAIADLYSGIGSANEFDSTIEKLRNSPGGETDYYLEKIRDAQRRSNVELALQYINEALSKLPENERMRFSQMRNIIENPPDSRKASDPQDRYMELLQEFEDDKIYDPQTFFELGLLAMARSDLNTATAMEDRLKTIEGDEGTRWRYLSSRRLLALWQAQGGRGHDELLINARSLQQDIALRRPNWDMAFVLQAEIEKASGNQNEAISAYQMAIEKGTRQQSVYRDLISLYYGMNRADEGSRLRNQAITLFGPGFAQEDNQFPAPYQGYYEQIYDEINKGNIETATSLAKDCLKRAVLNKAPTDLIIDLNMQIGKLFFTVNHNEVAEQFLSEAAKFGGRFVYPLAVCYVKMEKTDEAFELILRELEKDDKNAPNTLMMFLRLYSQVQPSEAVLQKIDEQLVRLEPQFLQRTETLLILADYWIKRKRLTQAIALYRKGLESNPNHLWILNNLAMLITEQALGKEAPLVQGTFDTASGAKRISLPTTSSPQKSYIIRFPNAESPDAVPKTSDFRFLAKP